MPDWWKLQEWSGSERMKAITVGEDNLNNMNNIITKRNIFGLAGNATGEEALAMLKGEWGWDDGGGQLLPVPRNIKPKTKD